jgi:hypothetical protein
MEYWRVVGWAVCAAFWVTVCLRRLYVGLREDLELVCDTALKIAHVMSDDNAYPGLHPRLDHSDPVEEERVDWDAVDGDLPQVPSVQEIESTMRDCGGDAREAAYILMRRRGVDTDDDEQVATFNALWANA